MDSRMREDDIIREFCNDLARVRPYAIICLMQEENGQDKLKNGQPGNEVVLVWAILITVFIGSLWLVFGLYLTPLIIIILFVGVVFAFRYTYFSFYLALFLLPFLGITVSFPTASLRLGQRAFGGSIDLYLGEVILLFVLAAWAMKIFVLWYERRDKKWRPRLPLLKPYLTLAAAHFVSIFSPYKPDAVLALKFVVRPVIFCYLAFIALPVNLIRSRRRLRAVLMIMMVVGCAAALNGLVSLGSIDVLGSWVWRARPMALFGVNPIGENHNVLAELLLATGPMTLALGALVKKVRNRRVLYGLAALQTLVALLTLARTAWLVFLAQLIFMFATEWRHTVKKYLAELVLAIILLSPLAWFQLQFSFSPTAQSSNSTRWMLTDIAYQSFLEHPIMGSGAGTFMNRVGNAFIFFQEFGNPLDAHGFIQKLMVETGLLGLLAYAFLLWRGAVLARKKLHALTDHARLAGYALVAAAGGAICYQFLNTAYWTAHMWLPVGIMLAGLEVLRAPENQEVQVLSAQS